MSPQLYYTLNWGKTFTLPFTGYACLLYCSSVFRYFEYSVVSHIWLSSLFRFLQANDTGCWSLTIVKVMQRVGIFTKKREDKFTLVETIYCLHTPHGLWNIFINMLINDYCYFSSMQNLFTKCLFGNFLSNNGNNQAVMTLLLQDISHGLEEHGKILPNYVLPQPNLCRAEVSNVIYVCILIFSVVEQNMVCSIQLLTILTFYLVTRHYPPLHLITDNYAIVT